MKTGYRSYKLLYFNNLLNLENIEKGLKGIVKSIKEGEVYVVLIEVGYEGNFYSLSKALYISDEDSVHKAIAVVKNHLTVTKLKYRMEGPLQVAIKGRVFLSDEEYSVMKNSSFRKELINKLDKIQKEYNNNIKVSGNNVKILLEKLSKESEAVTSKPVNTDMLYLHASVYSLLDDHSYITSEKFIDNKINESNYTHSTKITVNKDDTNYSWVDHHYTDGTIKRIYNGNTYVFKDKALVGIVYPYNFPNVRKPTKDHSMTTTIGVIDIETYCENNGKAVPYAAGFKVGNNLHTFYYQENDSFNDVVVRMMKFIYDNYPGYTFFVHNLDFDGIYLLNAIVKINQDINKLKVIMNDKLFIKISTPKIKIIDSYKFLHASLGKILVDFQINYTKMNFPYSLVNEFNLFYKGYINNDFTNLSIHKMDDSYKNFDMKVETIKYLENDLNSLDAIINKFSTIIYNKYSVDITKSTTISSLAFKIFLTNYYKAKENVKVITGPVDMDIRNAHYGGVTAINQTYVTHALYYDMNSQYPSAMRNPMPVGNPTLSSYIDLDNSFGFFYAHILVPDNQMSLVPYRSELGEIEYPSTDFSGWYFSEELKALKQLNYQIKVDGGYLFDSSSTLFMSFVEDVYNERIQAKKNKNITLANILKLILNSLYGKTGMNPITTFTKVIPSDKLTSFDMKHTVISNIDLPNNYTLVRGHTKINTDLLKMFDKTLENKLPITTGNYTQSSVPLAAAISSYARISMFRYKTLSENNWYYSDTDSIVLEKELSSDWVSPDELGKMKLEHKIIEGYFLGPKFYAIVLENGETIIKASGYPSNQLSLSLIKDLVNGNEAKVNTSVFVKNYENSNAITIVDRPIKIKFNPKYHKLTATND